MLAHGVNLNSTILGSHNSSGNNTNSSSSSSSKMNAEIESSSNAAVNNQSTVPSTSMQHDSSHAVEVDMQHKSVRQADEDNKPTITNSTNKIEEAEELKKFFNLLNTYQQNPNFIAAIAAAAASAAANNAAPISSTNTFNSLDFIQQSFYMQQLQRSLNATNKIIETEQDTFESNTKKHHKQDKSPESNNKKHLKLNLKAPPRETESENDQNVNNENLNQQSLKTLHKNPSLAGNEYRKKIKSSHQRSRTDETKPSGEMLASSSFSSYSYSSSSSVSSSESATSPSSPPSPTFLSSTSPVSLHQKMPPKDIDEARKSKADNLKQITNINKQQQRLDVNNNIKSDELGLLECKQIKGGLMQSVSVPKLPSSSSSSKRSNGLNLSGDDYLLRSNLSFININKSSENIHALNGQSQPNQNSNAVSSEVKLKLKNAILQKLDRSKQNLNSQTSQPDLNANKSQMSPLTPPVNNNGKSQAPAAFLFDQHHFQQAIQANLQQQQQHEKNAINQQYLHYCQQMNEAKQSQEASAMVATAMNENLSTQIQLLNQLDENNLRRTTSEPNLKVKSALKDRLLEKRNVLNPFLSKRKPMASSHLQQRQPHTLPVNVSLSVSNLNKDLSSLSSMPSPSTAALIDQVIQQQYLHKSQQQNDSLLAAITAAAIHGANNSNSPEFVNLQNKQQLAASALLSLSNSHGGLSEEQKAYNISMTLHHLAASQQQQQQQQQQQVNSNSSNSQFLESLALASALAQQNHQNVSKKLASSLSFPMMPNQLMLNMLNSNKQSKDVQAKEASRQSIPKFGHAVHAEEENGMLLEDELKTAAKFNDTQKKLLLGSSEKLKYMMDESHQAEGDDFNWQRRLGSSMSNHNVMRQANTSQFFNSSLPHNLASQYYQLNQLDKAQQLIMLQHQEMEEQKLRQQQFHSNKLSYFSDPHLLRSLETTTISSQANINSVANKSSKRNQNFSPAGSSKTAGNSSLKQASALNNTTTSMDCSSIGQAEDRVYRYTTGIVYDTAMLKHECTCNNPSNHLETADRIKAIWARFKARDLIDECELVTSKLASISDLLLTHNEQYALIFGSDIEMRPKLPKEYLQTYMMNICIASCQGFALTYDQDNSWNEEHTPLACRVAIGSTYELAKLVTSGKLKNGFALVRPPGSHAEFNKPLGFCYFNTVAIVAKMLKKNLLLERILIVDWDVHHGNGTQQMTYNDPNILYISLHRHDNGNFFPGTGSINECGQEAGLGKNVNIAWNGKLNPAMGDAEYLAAFRCVVMPIAKAFKPQIVLVSCGFDGTESHPKELGGYKVSPMCFGYMTKKLMSLAEGRVVLALEGGYDKQSLCDCSEICLNALINKQIPSFSNKTLDAMPNLPAIQDLENVIDIQKQYWENLNEYKKYIKMSHNQFISVYTE